MKAEVKRWLKINLHQTIVSMRVVIRNLLLATGILSIVVLIILTRFEHALFSLVLSLFILLNALICLGQAIYMYVGSKVGKLKERDRLLDLLRIDRDEEVLDVGCGRGVLLYGAAKRLTSGKAVDIDVWNEQDLSGNSIEATRANAVAEGATTRV